MHLIVEEPQLHDLVRDTIARWRDGEEPNAAALLTRHPDLSRHKRLAVDLIYEEFCLRNEAGAPVVRSTFCDRFPGYQASLVKMLEVHDELQHGSNIPREQPLDWPEVGESFLGYQLVEALGRGALARVFLAREAALGGRLVVVKISQHGASEAHTLGKIAHPAIVPVFSVRHHEATGWTVICMPLVGAATATDLIDAAFAQGRPAVSAGVIPRVARQFVPSGVPRDEQSSPEEQRLWQGPYVEGIARFALHLAEGLRVAHGAGILHRDIKPSNVLLSWSGLPMLLDFNLSTDSGQVSQRVGGTLPYMAPELMRGMGSHGPAVEQRTLERHFDPRADIFSLGAVLFHLLTGRLPASPQNAEQLPANAIEPWLTCRQQRVQPLRALNPAVDPELQAIVLKCLAFEPEQRYATAEALGEALHRYLGPLARTQRLLRRRRRTILLAAAGAAAVSMGGIAYTASLPPYEERLFARGLREFDRGDFDKSAESFEKCVKLRPDWQEAIFAHGQALRQMGEFMDARTVFLRMSAEHMATNYALAGFCMLEADDIPNANRLYRIARLNGGATDPTTLTNSAHCLRIEQEYRLAIDLLDRAIELDPRYALAYYQRALCTLAPINDAPPLPQTVRDIERACVLEPANEQFHFWAALILVRGRNPESQATEIKEHLRLAAANGCPARNLKQAIFKDWLDGVSLDGAYDGPYRPLQHGAPAATPRLAEYLQGTSPSRLTARLTPHF